MTRELLGSIWTDTAMLVVGDPCQLITDETEYEAFCDRGEQYTETPMVVGGKILSMLFCVVQKTWEVKNNLDGTGAIAVRTGTDGYFPVYLERDEQGKPFRLIVELSGLVEPEEERG